MTNWLFLNWVDVPVAVACLAAALMVWRALTTRPGRVGQRLGLWIVAVFFTFFGPFSAVHPTWPPTAWAAAVNAEADFKDLWLAMIAMLVFSMSNIADNMLRSYGKLTSVSQFIVPLALASYFVAITVGLAMFASFSSHQTVGLRLRDILAHCVVLDMLWRVLGGADRG